MPITLPITRTFHCYHRGSRLPDLLQQLPHRINLHRTLIARIATASMNSTDQDSRIRAAIEEHWRASEAGDIETEHAIYATDAVLEYPQSGERFRSRAKISAQRGGHPANRHFTIRRIFGGMSLWVSEVTITYDSVPSHSVSIMEFKNEQVVHETQYFGDTFKAPTWREALSEPRSTEQESQ
jgi:hypothetical protein